MLSKLLEKTQQEMLLRNIQTLRLGAITIE